MRTEEGTHLTFSKLTVKTICDGVRPVLDLGRRTDIDFIFRLDGFSRTGKESYKLGRNCDDSVLLTKYSCYA